VSPTSRARVFAQATSDASRDRLTDPERCESLWRGLNPPQADGRECVMCESSFCEPAVPEVHRLGPRPGTRSTPSGINTVPVGRSETGSQVFACIGICAALAWPD
jgi:hypothetical protein